MPVARMRYKAQHSTVPAEADFTRDGTLEGQRWYPIPHSAGGGMEIKRGARCYKMAARCVGFAALPGKAWYSSSSFAGIQRRRKLGSCRVHVHGAGMPAMLRIADVIWR